MDIRIDIFITGFHHSNPNVYIPTSFVNNPNNKYNLKYMPLTIFNLSKVDHLYIGKDTIVMFADTPEFETNNVEIASEDKKKEHLAKPRHWIPQKHETLQQMYQALTRFTCRTKKSTLTFARGLKKYVKSMDRHSENIMRTLADQSLSKWM